MMDAINGEKETVLADVLEVLVPLFLLALNLLIYWQVTRHGFLNYLDDPNLVNNSHVRDGISAEGVAWCFRIADGSGWRPLAWFSHMLDFHLYRFNPGAHHLTSLFFHTVNTLLLFLFLRRATGARWCSAFVAVAFAVHPLSVESVAWLWERKTVLSTCFLFTGLWSYVLYTEKPSIPRYFFCLFLCALGLLAGPMGMSLPLLLLIMDYWPLRRLRFKSKGDIPGLRDGPGLRGLILGKVPFIVLAAFSTAAPFLVLRHGGNLPSGVSLAEIFFSYLSSLSKILLPHPLSVLYQPFGNVSAWMAAGSGLLVLSVSVLVVLLRRFPYLAAGWFWYLVTLTAAIVVGQVPDWRVMTDRFSYVPLIGILIIAAWGGAGVAERLRYGRVLLALVAGILISAMAVMSWSQTRHWQNGLTLFSHAVTVTPGDAVARNQLGFALARGGKYPEAMDQLTEALRLKSDYAEAHVNLGLVLDEQGRFQEAIRHFSEALTIDPKFARAHAQWALVLTRKGLLREAEKHYLEALRIDQEDAEIHNNFGVALYGEGRFQEAIHHYSEALRIRPEYADARRNLDNLLRSVGRNPGKNSAETPPP